MSEFSDKMLAARKAAKARREAEQSKGADNESNAPIMDNVILPEDDERESEAAKICISILNGDILTARLF